jgi:hypothetical protein
MQRKVFLNLFVCNNGRFSENPNHDISNLIRYTWSYMIISLSVMQTNNAQNQPSTIHPEPDKRTPAQGWQATHHSLRLTTSQTASNDFFGCQMLHRPSNCFPKFYFQPWFCSSFGSRLWHCWHKQVTTYWHTIHTHCAALVYTCQWQHVLGSSYTAQPSIQHTRCGWIWWTEQV